MAVLPAFDRRHRVRFRVIALRAAIAAIAILLTAWLESAPAGNASYFGSEWLRDRLTQSQATNKAETRIAIIDIDEASLKAIGAWPWPRARLADLIELLIANYQVRGIGLDVVLPEAADAAGDTRLAMLAQHGPLVLAQAFDYLDQPHPVRVGQLIGAETHNRAMTTFPASGFIANHAGLASAAHAGNIGFIPDRDGTLRRLPLLTEFENKTYPTLALALLECCADKSTSSPTNTALQTDARGLLRVPFRRDWSAYRVISASAILNQQIDSEQLRQRLVLIGSSALGLTDRVSTPLGPSTSGVLVHAALLSALLDGQAGDFPAPWPGRAIALLFAILISVVAAFSFPRLPALANVALIAAACGCWLALAYAISPHDAEFSPSAPLATMLFLLTVAVPFDWQLSQRKSQRLLGTLRQYVAREVVEELLRSDLKDPLAPRKLQVTTLIADIEAYTSHVESLQVEEAAAVTRDLLDCLTRPVLEHKGTLDKYTGDGLVAFWGAPLPNDDHADLALDAAQKIIHEVFRYSQGRVAIGQPPLRVRIGIESGIAMAGDFGTSMRSIYTAVGDSVNVASRLEQAARTLPHDIIVGAGTVELARRHRFIELGERVLRGKEHPTKLFTLEPHA